MCQIIPTYYFQGISKTHKCAVIMENLYIEELNLNLTTLIKYNYKHQIRMLCRKNIYIHTY